MVATREKMVIITNELTTVTTTSRSRLESKYISDQITSSSVVQSEREGETAVPNGAKIANVRDDGDYRAVPPGQKPLAYRCTAQLS
jgi:hypothetical protein